MFTFYLCVLGFHSPSLSTPVLVPFVDVNLLFVYFSLNLSSDSYSSAPYTYFWCSFIVEGGNRYHVRKKSLLTPYNFVLSFVISSQIRSGKINVMKGSSVPSKKKRGTYSRSSDPSGLSANKDPTYGLPFKILSPVFPTRT